MNFIEDLKYNLKQKNSLTILIYINLAVFIVAAIIRLYGFLMQSDTNYILKYLGLPAIFDSFKTRPWSIITYMFTHMHFLHILFNLLFLYWFGSIFVRYLSQRQLLGVYLTGGIIGGIIYMLSFNFFPVFEDLRYVSVAIGASASVMAIVIASASLVPDHKIFMLFFGQVKLKYIAIAVIIIDVISIPVDNAGGHIAHLGGALFGFIFIVFYKKGRDLTKPMIRIIDFFVELFAPKPKIHVSSRNKKKSESDHEYNARKKAEQQEIDKILEKISQSGYQSLSDKEKEKLFKSSKKR
jgi:membrane associated rhomboid family serine protease